MRSLPLSLAVVVLAGSVRAQQLPRLQHFELPGQPIQYFGAPLVMVGDIDHDGVDDFAVGSPMETLGYLNSPQQVGVVRVLSGATGAVIHTLTGQYQFDRFGWRVGGGGDVDADGTPDILVGLSAGANTAVTGNVQVYSGRTGGLLRTIFAGPLYGACMACADIDGDGFADIITSSDAYNLPSANQILPVKAYSGYTGLQIGSYSGAAAGVNNPFESWGSSLAAGEDLNGDGVPDILIGYSSAGGVGNQHGGVYAFSGMTGNMFRVFTGAPVYTFLGETVAFTADVDGDGVADVVAGGSGSGSVSVPGSVWVFSGATGYVLCTVTSSTLSDDFGAIIAAGRDLNGDGAPDFVVATPNVNPTGPPVQIAFARGVVRAYDGRTGAPIGYIGGRNPGNNFGSALGLIQDSNGDGFNEIVVGSIGDDTINGADAGSVDVVELMGGQPYGSGNGTLQLLMLPGPPLITWVTSIAILGATPLGSGYLAADTAAAGGTLGNPPFPVFLAMTPGLVLLPINFDSNGTWIALLNLRIPPIAGTVIFTQAFDLGGPSVVASAGLSILFGN